MRLTTGILLSSAWLLMGAACENRPDPPSTVEVRVAVPVPCEVAEPQCRLPAYDAATRDMPGDRKVKLLRSEAINYGDCVRRYREALAACRRPPNRGE